EIRQCLSQGRWEVVNSETSIPARSRRSASPIRELQIEAHGWISRHAILPRWRRKENRRLTGLPGKLPVSRLVTMYRPSFCSTATGSLVYEYLAEAPFFNPLMAAGPE